MGTREELERLIRLCVDKGVRPVIHSTLPLNEARQGFETMLKGETAGKIVFTAPRRRFISVRLSLSADLRLGQLGRRASSW